MGAAAQVSGRLDAKEYPTRRRVLRVLASFVAGSPLVARAGAVRPHADPERAAGRRPRQSPSQQVPQAPYAPEVMQPVNLHEFEEVAKRKLSVRTYDYIAAGSADDLTLQENRAAFGRYWVRRGVMRDVSVVDTSVELLGQQLEHPVLLGPVGLRNLLHPDGHLLTARAAQHTRAIMVGASPEMMEELGRSGQAPVWWASTLGHSRREEAAAWAARNEDAGAAALCVSVDYPYSGARDRPARHQWEREWSNTGVYGTSEGEVIFQAGMLDPYTPELTWEWLEWVRGASRLPIVVKGIVTGADARLAVERGAQAIVVSNHGGRTLDGERGTLDALPEVVDAVRGGIPVLVDGGIRRGGDVLKALGLGATAILIGRPYLWGLGAFGQEGVQRVVELLVGELRTALGLSGFPRASAVDRSLIRPAWKPWTA